MNQRVDIPLLLVGWYIYFGGLWNKNVYAYQHFEKKERTPVDPFLVGPGLSALQSNFQRLSPGMLLPSQPAPHIQVPIRRQESGQPNQFIWLPENVREYEHFSETIDAMFPGQFSEKTQRDTSQLRHWFKNEGKGLMKAAIFVLVKPIHCGPRCSTGPSGPNKGTDCSHLKSMENLASSLEKRIFSARDGGVGLRYPLIIFHDDWNEEDINVIARAAKSTLVLGHRIEFDAAALPLHLGERRDRVLSSFRAIHPEGNLSMPCKNCHDYGYRIMCRFFAGLIHHAPLLRELDYYMRLDGGDSRLDGLARDPFALLESRGAIYGYFMEPKRKAIPLPARALMHCIHQFLVHTPGAWPSDMRVKDEGTEFYAVGEGAMYRKGGGGVEGRSSIDKGVENSDYYEYRNRGSQRGYHQEKLENKRGEKDHEWNKIPKQRRALLFQAKPRQSGAIALRRGGKASKTLDIGERNHNPRVKKGGKQPRLTCGFNSNNGRDTNQPMSFDINATLGERNHPAIPLYKSISHPNIPYFAYNNFEVRGGEINERISLEGSRSFCGRSFPLFLFLRYYMPQFHVKFDRLINLN